MGVYRVRCGRCGTCHAYTGEPLRHNGFTVVCGSFLLCHGVRWNARMPRRGTWHAAAPYGGRGVCATPPWRGVPAPAQTGI